MGKSEKGAIWLDAELLSPYEYWQFWRNTSDEDVVKFLKYFTEIDILNLNEIVNKEKNINNLKILLANETTKILHGEKEAKSASQTAADTFTGIGISKNLPEILISKSELIKGTSLISIISSNLILSSKSEARRAIKNNGIKINDILISDENKIILKSDFKQKNYLKISYGKKKHYILKYN